MPRNLCSFFRDWQYISALILDPRCTTNKTPCRSQNTNAMILCWDRGYLALTFTQESVSLFHALLLRLRHNMRNSCFISSYDLTQKKPSLSSHRYHCSDMHQSYQSQEALCHDNAKVLAGLPPREAFRTAFSKWHLSKSLKSFLMLFHKETCLE
ncbi:hypothetical protein J6590_015453 [Homalodisca vitripennis]|nr:hypothetical protein J6590_015453 [Homalodisca vitripennis]